MKYITLIILSINSYAYTPTIESLLRQGSEIDTLKNTVALNLRIYERVEDKKNKKIKKEDETPTENKTFYSKMIFGNENEKIARFIDLDYGTKGISTSNLRKIHHRYSLRASTIDKNSESIERRAFYAMITSIFYKDGAMLIDLANSLGANIKKNTELVNSKKMHYLYKYKNYLKESLLEDSELEIESPLNPSDPNEKEGVNEIMSQFFYEKSPYVSRIKEGNNYFWKIEEKNIEAKFDVSSRNMEYLKINIGDDKSIEFYCKSYSVFNGTFELPQFVYIKDLSDRYFIVELDKFSSFSDTPENFSKRLSRYEKKLSENRKVEIEEIDRPHFLIQ